MNADPLVIGVGNPDRGDDGAGPAVVGRVRGRRTVEVRDSAGLVELWRDEDEVIVVDAMVTGRPPGTVARFDVGTTELPAGAFASTHAFGLSTAVELSRALGRLPRSLEVYGIEAAQLAPGSAMSPQVEQAVLWVVAEIESEPH